MGDQPQAFEEIQPEEPTADAETLREARWAAQLIKTAAQSEVDRLAPELIDDILEVPDPKPGRA